MGRDFRVQTYSFGRKSLPASDGDNQAERGLLSPDTISHVLTWKGLKHLIAPCRHEAHHEWRYERELRRLPQAIYLQRGPGA